MIDLKKINKQFVKETKIPITVYEEKYFDYFISLYNNLFNSEYLYNQFKEKVNSVGGIKEYMDLYNEFKDNVISTVKSKEDYLRFISLDMKNYDFNRVFNSENRNFYTKENSNKKWISVDLAKANFHSLKHVSDKIVDGKDTYEEWILSFENGELFVDSKSVRQIIFGNLNPKRQQKVQNFYLNLLMESISNDIKDIKFNIMGADEFLIEYDPEVEKIIREHKANFENNYVFSVNVEVFNLKYSGNEDFGYIKEFSDGNVELKGTNKFLFAQAYKSYIGDIIHPYDLLFYHENRLATYINI